MSKIIVIGDHDMALGFALVGLRECVSATNETVEAELEKALANPDAGMIILLEDLLLPLSHKMRTKVENSAVPVVVTIPGKAGSKQAAGNLQALIKKAIGVELKQ